MAGRRKSTAKLTVVQPDTYIEPEPDRRSIHQKINDGEYNAKIAYPDKPKTPAILKANVKDLTDEEIATIPQVRAEHNAAMEVYKAQAAEYGRQEGEGEDRFKADLEAAYGVQNNPKKEKLFSIAYDEGHAYGKGEVASKYGKYVVLIQDDE